MNEHPSPGQQRALDKLQAWWQGDQDVFLLAGLAGTGKTWVLAHLEEVLGLSGREVRYVCPTWKASQVLTKRLPVGQRATSVHNLIYRPLGIVHADGCATRTTGDCDKGCRNLVFEFSPSEVPPKLIVVDEASMLSAAMLDDLQRLGARIVLVGDPGQLPPVKGASIFRLYRKNVMLGREDIVRQQADSTIIQLAHMVRERDPRWLSKAAELGGGVTVTDAYKVDLGMHASGEAIIISYRNVDVSRFNGRVRKLLGLTGDLAPGDRVMALENDRDLGIFNGQVGTVTPSGLVAMETGVVYRGRVEVRHDSTGRGRRRNKSEPVMFRHAFAATCHKFQGSEAPRVVLRGSRPAGDDRWPWIYTAITRAKDELVINI